MQWVPGNLFKDQLHNFGPSLGFAWDPFSTGKTAIRANYRMAYDRINTFVIASQVLPNLPGSAVAVVNQSFGQSGGRLANLPALSPPTTQPSALTQPSAFAAASNTVVDPNIKTPRTHQWSFGIQREVVRNTVLDVAYIGRRAYHLLGAYNVNQAEIFKNGFLDAFNTVKAGGDSPLMDSLLKADSRLQANETGSQMVRRLYACTLSINSVGALASAIASRLQNGQSVTQLSLGQPFFFIPYPQFTGGLNVLDSNDFSTYNGLEVQLDHRFRNGLSFNIAYTLSKSLDTRSFDPTITVVSTANSASANSTPFDVNNRRLNYAPSDFDRRHVLQWNFVAELPFGRGKRLLPNLPKFLDRALGGWEAAGSGRITSGRPFTVYSGSYTFSSVVQTPANCNGCTPGEGTPYLDSASGFIWYLNPSQTGQFSIPAAGQFGNVGRNSLVGPHSFELDASLLKRVPITERVKLEIRADATNLTNSVDFGPPTATVTSTTFGRINNTIYSGFRKIQLGAKVHF